MRLVLLGTTGYHPNDARHTLCLLLPECGVMLDAGTGMFRAAEYLQTSTLDIFLTHAHLDHVIGLTYLFDVMHERPLERVTVHGEAAKLAAINEHLFHPALFPKKPPLEFRPLEATVPLPGGGQLRWFPLNHPGGSVGYRLDWPDRSLAYVTDTTASAAASYVQQIRNVDLLIHECYFGDEDEAWAEVTGHSCTTHVAEVAKAALVSRLVLVHLNPRSSETDPIDLSAARAVFPATLLGHDRLEIALD